MKASVDTISIRTWDLPVFGTVPQPIAQAHALNTELSLLSDPSQ
jgi:hypothetical protein